MGNSDSCALFIAGVQELTNRELGADDEFWNLLFRAPLSTEDVFSIMNVDFLRKLKDKYPENLRLLLEKIIAKMKEICQLVKQKKAPWAEAQLCIRLITRIAPFLQENPDDATMDALLWDARDGGKSIGSELFHYINRFLFLERFTVIPVPGYEASKDEKPPTHKVDVRLLWKGGIGAPETLLAQQTNQLIQQRVEVLRCLLSSLSGPLFQTVEEYGHKPSKWLLSYTSGDQPYTANLFCSLMSTVFTYDPVGWGLPYGSLLSSNIEEELVDHSLQVLCVLIDFIPTDGDEEAAKVKNVYRYMLKSFSKQAEYDIVFNGLVRLLETIHVAKTTILPKSKPHVNFYQEALVLLWHMMNANPGFLNRSVADLDSNKILVPIIYLLQMSRNRPSLIGLLHMSSFILLVFSSSRDFGVRLNQPFHGKLPLDIPRFSGNYADLLLLSAHKIISDFLGVPQGDSLIDMLLTVLCNVSPYIKSFCLESSLKIIQLVERCAKPAYLFRSPHHHQGFFFLLDFLNNVIQYQFEGNAMLVYSCLRQKEVFLAVDRLTFEDGMKRSLGRASVVSTYRSGSVDAETDALQKEGGANDTTFEGDQEISPKVTQHEEVDVEDDADNADETTHLQPKKASVPDAAESPSSSSVRKENAPEMEPELLQDAPAPNVATEMLLSACDDETRSYMEEKTKERSFQRDELNVEWFNEWKSRLPIDTVLRLCEHLGPKVEQFCKDKDGLADQADIVEFLKQETMVGLLPVPHPIVIRTYEPNRYTALWFTSYLWGVIFTRSQALPLYDMKKIRLIVINQ
eukprot:GEMP01007843.1.p1 GENE.GEMP01007843.1~~GEMP01007843.1.p1  ORF type:complete len:798 (-),score=139.11 GEMP01007843.1:1162-3555(-)